MLMLGRALVTLVGLGMTLFSATAAFLLFTGTCSTFGRCLPDPVTGAVWAVLGVATFVATIAMAKGRAWGAAVIALGTAGVAVPRLGAPETYPLAAVLAIATLLATSVAIGMARDKSLRRGAAALTDGDSQGPMEHP